MQILIVDDDFTSRKLLARCVRALGECDQACDGLEAYDAYRSALAEQPYDLILLDIMMPGMDGGEVLRRIRADERSRGVAGSDRCRIVMSTVLSDKEAVIGAFHDEADGYILKPYSRESVLADLRRHQIIGKEG